MYCFLCRHPRSSSEYVILLALLLKIIFSLTELKSASIKQCINQCHGGKKKYTSFKLAADLQFEFASNLKATINFTRHFVTINVTI